MNTENTDESQTLAGLLRTWTQAYRQDFARDKGARFESVLQRFGLAFDPQAMLEGTIEFVSATAAMMDLDNRDLREFLAAQRYDAQGTTATYALLFDVCSCGAACLLVTPDLKFVDLADLYGWPWDRLELVGYTSFWVYRIDGQDLEPPEVEALERHVTNDIAFDYGDDEVLMDFDPDSFDGALVVTIQDIPDE